MLRLTLMAAKRPTSPSGTPRLTVTTGRDDLSRAAVAARSTPH